MNINEQRRQVIERLQALGKVGPVSQTPAFSGRETLEPHGPRPIAVIGLAGTFPQSPTLHDFWAALDRDQSLIEEIPKSRFDWRRGLAELEEPVGRWGGFLPDVRGFDAAFFNILPSEADLMDPRQRLLLPAVYQSLEDAGLAPGSLQGGRTGVFIGAEANEYAGALAARGLPIGDGHGESMLANRISHFFDLRGPSEVVNTMCSGAAVAVHRAMTALRNGDIDLAVVGAVNLILQPGLNLALARSGQMSPEATVRSFGRDAAGFLRSEGAGAVVLKALADAERDGDPIYALIRHSAVNYNGRGGLSMAMPNVAAHAELVAQCYREAGIDITDLGLIEAQGMGNPVGDMAEWEALNRALDQLFEEQGLPRKAGSVRVSTLKPMLGHMHAASALGALAKIVRSLQTNTAHRILDFEAPHPNLDIEGRIGRLLQETEAWPSGNRPRLAGLHSYGAGGNNAHLLLEEYRAPVRRSASQGPFLLPLSAADGAGLRAKVTELAAFLSDREPDWAAVAHTLQVGRDALPERVAFLINDGRDWREQVDAYLTGCDHDGVYTRTEGGASAVADDAPGAARAWVQGAALDWSAWRPHVGVTRLHLPTHTFADKEHWFDVDRAVTSVDATQGDALGVLRRLLSPYLQQTPEQVDVDREFSEMGFDSKLVLDLCRAFLDRYQINLEAALFFDYNTPRRLAAHLEREHGAAFGRTAATAVQRRPVTRAQPGYEPIAVVGLAGRYPHAPSPDLLWQRLLEGADCIDEIPADRWDRALFEPDPERAALSGKSYGKWGGFLEGLYHFDPLFFNMSPREAPYINPKERLFLQTAWQVLEDAGTYPEALSGERVGVFVGVTRSGIDPYATSSFSVANRVSYTFDFNGPSLTLDTACSSSLVAIHEACRHIHSGECSVALAGGVHAFLHPSHFVALSLGQFLSPDGRCKSFGASADGMVPGEGVGAVLLKPLAAALADGDSIHGVIRGSATNHGGKSNGFTVPSAKAHRDLMEQAMARAGCCASAISCVEAHGTGTALGDPIEVRGLRQAFEDHPGACSLGSLKSNLGHLEAAAGVAGLTKVLLQLKHRTLVPSLHAAEANPQIDFGATPFQVQQEAAPWLPVDADGEPQARVACLSSFGAGGSNAHLIIEEAPASRQAAVPADLNEPVMLVLSAKTENALRESAANLAAFLGGLEKPVDLRSVAFTLQVGRAPLEERAGVLVSQTEEAVAALRDFAEGRAGDRVVRGRLLSSQKQTQSVGRVRDALARRDQATLLALWTQGATIPWPELYEVAPSRISLPVYPFAREFYRLPEETPDSGGVSQLHPVLHENRSTLQRQQYVTELSGDAFFLADHVVGGEKILPGVVYLEMARAALAAATDWERVLLRNIVWLQPVVVDEPQALTAVLKPADDGAGVAWEIVGDEGVVYCQGRGENDQSSVPADWTGQTLKRGARVDGPICYQTYESMGMVYGPRMRAVETIQCGDDRLVAWLTMPEGVDDPAWVLHPSLLDGALQSIIALAISRRGQGKRDVAYMPFALTALHSFGPLRGAMRAVIVCTEENDTVLRCDLTLYDEAGCCQALLRGFSSRARAAGPLHPLVHRDLGGGDSRRFQSVFTGREFFLADHVVNGSCLLPGVAYLEMARAAGCLGEFSVAGLGNVVWAKAITVTGQAVPVMLDLVHAGDTVDFLVTGADEVRHAQGRLLGAAQRPERPQPLAVKALRARCIAQKEAHECWGVADAAALAAQATGASFRALTQLAYNDDEALAHFQLPEVVKADRDQYVLHPSLLDVAFETVQFWNGFQSGKPTPWLPFSLEKCWLFDALPDSGFVHMRPRRDGGAMALFDIDLCDELGSVCVALRGYAAMPVAAPETALPLLATTAWRQALPDLQPRTVGGLRLVLCRRNDALIEALDKHMPESEVLTLEAVGDDAAAVIANLQQLLVFLQENGEPPLVVVADDADDPQVAAMTALLKTWHTEHPGSLVKLLIADGADASALCRALETLVGLPGREVLARYEAGALALQNLVPLADDAVEQPLLDTGDVVWITGGLGGLGRHFARYFTSLGAKVVLSGRSSLDARKQRLLDELNHDGEVVYQAVDLTDRGAVVGAVGVIRAQYGRLDAVVHAAGVLHDGPLLEKTGETVAEVLAPKVAGVLALDEALADSDLKWWVLCSSLAGVICPPHQGDYAAANAFLDAFAAQRNQQVQQGGRHGRTVSINWPLWREGGMGMDAAAQALMTQATGLVPLESELGCRLLAEALHSDADHVLVLPGDPTKIRTVFLGEAEETTVAAPAPVKSVDPKRKSKLLEALIQMVAELQHVALDRIEADGELTRYGFDSISFTNFANLLNTRYGLDLMPTVFFEHTTPARLAAHLLATTPEAFQETQAQTEKTAPAPAEKPATASAPRFFHEASPVATVAEETPPAKVDRDAVAVIGMAGRFPGSPDLDTFWDNLVHNRDLTREVPEDRWDWRRIYGDPHQTPGKTKIYRAGFIEDIDCFDPLFFGISPREAESLDPQFRLFLETVWAAMNDAAVTAQSLAGSKTGVFAGVTTRDYQTLLQQAEWGQGTFMASLLCHFTVANRVSYQLDLRGASEPIDTACSSSLVAVHHAVEQIQQGKCEMAFAGGINLIADPGFMIAAGTVGMLSEDGRCKTFDQQADGFGRGEGVGVVLLKSLAQALADGDPIHGVIRATAENHGGKAASPTTPNPVAQQALLVDAYRRAGLEPHQIGYIETHGTGTKLGDPIEVNGLKGAFAELSESPSTATARTALGSVKANVGHLEAAAGIVGMIKVLLMMKHRTIPGNIHLNQVNPYLKIEEGPFYLPTDSQAWPAPQDDQDGPQPRRAGVSSFGIGGTNAHVVLEEASVVEGQRPPAAGPFLFVLSALNSDRLQAVASALSAWFARHGQKTRLDDLAYTLQVGRDALPQRAAFLAHDGDTLNTMLAAVSRGESPDGLWLGRVEKGQSANLSEDGEDLRSQMETWLRDSQINEVANLWLGGTQPDWDLLYPQGLPRRISLPAYPFARQRYWGPDSAQTADVADTDNAVLTFEETWLPQPRNLAPPVLDAPVLWLLPPGASAEHVPAGCLSVALEAPLQSDRLLAQVNAVVRDHGTPETLVCCWPPFDQNDGLHIDGLLHLIQVLHATKVTPARLLLGGSFRNEMQRMAWDALIGAARSLRGLLPDTQVKVVFYDLPDHAGFDRLWREIDGPDAAVCYQQQQRLVPNVAEVNATTHEASPLRTQGTYLITGGCGGLGLLFAKHLAARVAGNLILTGRAPLSPAKQAALAEIEAAGGRAVYLQADVADQTRMQAVVAEGVAEFGPIHGVIHAAGLPASGLVTDKTPADAAAVLAPKVRGSLVLDAVLAEQPLDFVAYFSSSSALLGDFGAVDYAVANRFQNAYAAGRRGPGKAVVINWPAWLEGGMGFDDADQRRLYLKSSGQSLLTAVEGLTVFEQCLARQGTQTLVLCGERERLIRLFDSVSETASAGSPAAEELEKDLNSDVSGRLSPPKTRKSARPELKGLDLPACVAWDLKELAATYLKMPRRLLGENTNLADFGFDSIALADFARVLSTHFDLAITPSVFFGYATLAKLTDFFVQEHGAAMDAFYFTAPEDDDAPAPVVSRPVPVVSVSAQTTAPARVGFDEIAVIGMSGRFPQARTVDEMWRILVEGRNAVGEVPEERFDWRSVYGDPHKNPFKTNGKWLGCVPGVAEFDPLFFEISPAEAERMDPRQRLLLQELWNALEDAGYGPNQLRGHRIGTFVGVEDGDYALATGAAGFTANHTGILAARLAYFLDLKGPNMALNTACSSSLVALHQACQSLRHGECDTALAAGVNLVLAPQTLVGLGQAGMLSDHGTCFAFDRRADGMVPGEAAVAVVLKPLSRALADGDPIHGVISASGINHDGRTNGITAPSGVAQVDLLQSVYRRFDIDARSVDYFVTHGTGTKLGDPIEANALNQVFKEAGAAPGGCAITSSKSNFGHTFAASGLLSLVNALQALRHQTIPAGLHCEVENDFIQWDQSPLVVNKSNRPWPVRDDRPRLAGVNAFGMSGTNATVVVRDIAVPEPPVTRPPYLLLVVSAKTKAALAARIVALVAMLEQKDAPDLSAVAYTLSAGRHHFQHRCAVVVAEAADALYALGRVESGDAANLVMGEVPRQFKGQSALQRTCDDLLRRSAAENDAAVIRENLLAGAELFCQGYALDGAVLFGDRPPRRIHLPGYPFARDHYWLKEGLAQPVEPTPSSSPSAEWLFLRESWQPAPIPDDFDWNHGLETGVGRALLIVADDQQAAAGLQDLLTRTAAAASLPAPSVTVIHADAVGTTALTPVPEVVLWLGPAQPEADGLFEEREPQRLLRFCSALMKQAWGESVRCLYICRQTKRTPRLACEALSGFLRSAMMENENHRWQFIRHDGNRIEPAQILVREWLFDDAGEHPLEKSDVRYCDGRREVRAFAETRLPDGERTCFRQGGVYVLAGGMGCLGTLVSRELAQRYAATLVLLSRSEPDDAMRAQCDELQRLGATVVTYAVDIADRDALAAVTAQITTELGPIHGVMNLARTHEDRMIAAKSWDSFQRVIRAKVQGTINLDHCTENQPLDFFLSFSSLGAYGVRGSADYAYATAFQNAFARYRDGLVQTGRRSGVSLSQCWGAWVEDRLFPESRRAIQEQGFGLIDIHQGFPAIEASLAGDGGALCLMRVTDMPRVRGYMGLDPQVATPAHDTAALIATWERDFGDGGLSFETLNQHMTFAAVEALEPVLVNRIHRLLFGAPPSEPPPETKQAAQRPPARLPGADLAVTIREHLAAVLKLKTVDDDGPFPAYGLDSISATVLATRLEKALDREVPVQWLVEFPTVQELVVQLQASVGKDPS